MGTTGRLAAMTPNGAGVQLLSLSGAWSPGAPAAVSTIWQDQIVSPLNQSGAEAAKRLHDLTGEDVGHSFDVLLERVTGNKVDALQTVLRAVLQLYRNGAVQLLTDAQAVVAPWQHNLTAASLAVVDGMRDSSLQTIQLLESAIDAPALSEAMKYYIEPKTAQALISGVHRALVPLQAECNRFARQMGVAIVEAVEGALSGVLDEAKVQQQGGGTTLLQQQQQQQEQQQPLPRSGGEGQVLDKLVRVTQDTFTALQASLRRPANSTADLAEVHDNLVRGWRSTADKVSTAARQRLRTSVRELKRTYARGVRAMARTLTAELMIGMRAALTASGSCARVGPAGEASQSLFA